MKNLKTLLAILFITTSLSAQTLWKVDPAHTQASFGITHLGISEVEGKFNDFEGSIQTTTSDFSDAKYHFVLDVASIDTGIEMRDDHLKSPDFFDAKKYPKMSFVSTSSEKVANGKYKVHGDLSFHGITKPVVLNVWHRGTTTNPQNKKLTAGFEVTGKILRSDFNLGNDFPEPMLSDEVLIDVDAEFIKE